ncbi:MAG: DeoR family transcriptional regulator [Deltaproteobacteria bacterium]|jgi:predicted transcriptional regulator
MKTEIRIGSIDNFFESAKQTAREIDEGKKLTRKCTIWVEPSNLNELLKRTELIQYLRNKKKITVRQMAEDMNQSSASLKRDLDILSKYRLIRIYSEMDETNRAQRLVEASFGNRKIEVKAEI